MLALAGRARFVGSGRWGHSRYDFPERKDEGLDGPHDAVLWSKAIGQGKHLVLPGPWLYRQGASMAYSDCVEAKGLLGKYFDIVASDRFLLERGAVLHAPDSYQPYTCLKRGKILWS